MQAYSLLWTSYTYLPEVYCVVYTLPLISLSKVA
jgi:hypothetical protein